MAELEKTSRPVRRTRCRTGCVRCRMRRRKCDEGKPRCRNCIDKGFQCQYGSRLTFLNKNVITVATPKVPQAYSSIKFVSGDTQSRSNETSSGEDNESASGKDNKFPILTAAPDSAVTSPVTISPTSIHAITTELQRDEQTLQDDHPFPHSADCGIETSSIDLDPRLSFYSLQDQTANPLYQHHDGHSRHGNLSVVGSRTHPEPEVISPIRVTENDAFAARGLLALISTEELNPISNTRSSIRSHHGRTASDATSFRGLEGAICTDVIVAQPAASQRTTELLRHYRYEIAPWLDLCDMNQSFGIALFQDAMDSEQALHSLLALAEASLRNKKIKRHSLTDSHPPRSPNNSFFEMASNHGRDTNNSLISTALTAVFHRVFAFMSSLSGAWSTNCLPSDMSLIGLLALDVSFSKPTSAIYWLYLRLELSSALANDDAIQFPLSLSLPWGPLNTFLENIDSLETLTQRLSNFAHRPLMILGQAMQLKSKDREVDGASAPGSNQLETWTNFINELERWREERPEEFRPILELDSSLLEPDSSFPTILFTNGAGLFGNQLYHTVMLFLLLGKPRTLRLPYLPSFVLSPLWHAQCICSISLNNDRRECWDPCLLASFIFAAKLMTHELQQQDIVHGLNRIQNLTGWNIRDYVTELLRKWALANAV